MSAFEKNIIGISDLEGFNINKYICIGCTNEACTTCQIPDNTQLIVCGDIMDSTKIDATTKLMETDKIFNLRNIMKIVENENIIITLGNRDINKIKCLLLNKLNNPKNDDLITRFNFGQLNFNDYNKFTQYNWAEDMDKWPIFWRDAKSKNESRNGFFYTRVLDIFTESMGAPNMLNSIYLELKEMHQQIVTQTNQMSSDYNDFDFKQSITDDHKAFILLIIFNRMLQKNTAGQTIYNTHIFDGLLYKFYTRENTFLCHSKIINENIYLFSHGGLTKTLLKKMNFQEIASSLKILPEPIIGNQKNTLEEKINYINAFYKKIITNIFTHLQIQENINFLLALSAPTKCGNNILTGDKCKNNEFNTELESPILAGFRNMRKIIYSEPNKNIYQIFGHQPVGFASTIDLFKINENKNYFINLDSTNSFTGTKLNNSDSVSIFKIINSIPMITSIINIDTSSFTPYDNKHIYKLLKMIEIDGKRISPLGTHYKSLDFTSTTISFDKNISEFDDILIKITKLNSNNKEFEINFHGYSNNFFYFTITNSGTDATGEKFNIFESFNKSFYILNINDMNNFFQEPTPTSILSQLKPSRHNSSIQPYPMPPPRHNSSRQPYPMPPPRPRPRPRQEQQPRATIPISTYPQSHYVIPTPSQDFLAKGNKISYEQKYLKYKEKYMKLKQELSLR